MKKFSLNTKIAFIALIALLCVTSFYAFKPEVPDNEGKKQYLMVTTLESIIPGGLGRSRMFITDQNGNLMVEDKMENFYSLVGINMGNINKNDAQVIKKVNELIEGGWVLENVSTGVQSPAYTPNGGKSQGIYLTRYLFAKSM